MNKEYYFLGEEIALQEVKPDLHRKVVARGGDMMIVEVHFKKGAVGDMHAHIHEQVTYCKSGSVEFDIEGEKQIIKAGDSVFMPINCLHGCVALEDNTVLLDIFTPQRLDFLV
ncbi:MAG: cupin domain-containing protein [Lachnospiraceae bacterium]